MFLVAGGNGQVLNRLDSIEIFDPLVGSWTESEARLPRPITFLRAENVNDRALIFGNYSFPVSYTSIPSLETSRYSLTMS